MNSKKAKQLKKEAKKFSDYTGTKWQEVYNQLKKTGKGVPLVKSA